MFFISYLKKEKQYGIETLSIDRVLNKKHFYGKIMQKCVPEAIPRLLHARNSFENKIF